MLSENDDAARYFLPRLNSLDASELIISRQEPAYPSARRSKTLQGNLVLQLTIGSDGTVERARVVGGYLSKNQALVVAATEAAKQWRYKPYLVGSRPVKFLTTITFRFDANTQK